MNIYLYDGTFHGYLTAVFYAYTDKNVGNIKKSSEFVPNLLDTPIETPTEEDKAQRIIKSIQEKLSSYTLRNLYYIFLSEQNDCELLAFRYLKLCYHTDNQINLAYQNPLVHQCVLTAKKVSLELQRMKGFVRFRKIDEIYYATIEPDHNILPLMIKHFTLRFSDQNFVIHDLKRKYALAYDATGKEHWFCQVAEEFSPQQKDEYIDLFRLFYQSVTIAERQNLRLQKQFMPTRYQKYMPETK